MRSKADQVCVYLVSYHVRVFTLQLCCGVLQLAQVSVTLLGPASRHTHTHRCKDTNTDMDASPFQPVPSQAADTSWILRAKKRPA